MKNQSAIHYIHREIYNTANCYKNSQWEKNAQSPQETRNPYRQCIESNVDLRHWHLCKYDTEIVQSRWDNMNAAICTSPSICTVVSRPQLNAFCLSLRNCFPSLNNGQNLLSPEDCVDTLSRLGLTGLNETGFTHLLYFPTLSLSPWKPSVFL